MNFGGVTEGMAHPQEHWLLSEDLGLMPAPTWQLITVYSSRAPWAPYKTAQTPKCGQNAHAY